MHFLPHQTSKVFQEVPSASLSKAVHSTRGSVPLPRSLPHRSSAGTRGLAFMKTFWNRMPAFRCPSTHTPQTCYCPCMFSFVVTGTLPFTECLIHARHCSNQATWLIGQSPRFYNQTARAGILPASAACWQCDPWACSLTRCLNFPICKIGIIIPPSSQGYLQNKYNMPGV